MEERSVDFEKIGRADLACRTAHRISYQWQVNTPGWRLTFAPSNDHESVVVTLHRMDTDTRVGTATIPVSDLDWRLPDADILKQVIVIGNRLVANWAIARDAPARIRPKI
jgi:hypothetical protein